MKAFHVSRADAKMETLQAIGPLQKWLAESAVEDEVTGLCGALRGALEPRQRASQWLRAMGQ